MMNLYYTYLHRRQSDNSVFYVGKGKGGRASSKSGRSAMWSRCAKKHGFTAEILATWPTEREALDHEVFLIQVFRDMGADLCNHTDGGEGVSGLKHSDEAKSKMSIAKAGKKQAPEIVASRVEKLRGQKRSLETRARLSAIQSDPEMRERISSALKAHTKTPDHEKKLLDAAQCLDRRIKISRALSGKKKSPEHIAKLLKPVVCVDTGAVFDSLKAAIGWMEAQGEVGVKSHSLSMVLTGKRKTVRGYKWAYADEKGRI